MARITVEDCLKKEGNRFALVLLASKRAKQLLSGKTPVADIRDNKSIVGALREIADGKVRFKEEGENDSGSAPVVEEEAEAADLVPGVTFDKVAVGTA